MDVDQRNVETAICSGCRRRNLPVGENFALKPDGQRYKTCNRCRAANQARMAARHTVVSGSTGPAQHNQVLRQPVENEGGTGMDVDQGNVESAECSGCHQRYLLVDQNFAFKANGQRYKRCNQCRAARHAQIAARRPAGLSESSGSVPHNQMLRRPLENDEDQLNVCLLPPLWCYFLLGCILKWW
jgi:hypothetical protein